eukprot:TRINITY_DN3499_c0_g1_i6.p1 TRINITY_DN3499_c0_g1~~TRINITY_DN3499_c0_g1_i6.p1  ORF type:complete len:218 (+),score=93.93 TRINITY_DN3499_c0_g1_i6:960-1613(+)
MISLQSQNEQTQIKTLKRILTLLETVVERQWDIRFAQVEVVGLMELNWILNYISSNGWGAILRPNIDVRLSIPLPNVGLRIVLDWDSDMTDVEMIVSEPKEEICSVYHNHTTSGAILSREFTGGYGPVEYLVVKPMKGTYIVSLKLNHSPSSKPFVVCQVSVWISENASQNKTKLSSIIPHERVVAVLTNENQTETVASIFIPDQEEEEETTTIDEE